MVSGEDKKKSSGISISLSLEEGVGRGSSQSVDDSSFIFTGSAMRTIDWLAGEDVFFAEYIFSQVKDYVSKKNSFRVIKPYIVTAKDVFGVKINLEEYEFFKKQYSAMRLDG
jgi:hypothetical protein